MTTDTIKKYYRVSSYIKCTIDGRMNKSRCKSYKMIETNLLSISNGWSKIQK